MKWENEQRHEKKKVRLQYTESIYHLSWLSNGHEDENRELWHSVLSNSFWNSYMRQRFYFIIEEVELSQTTRIHTITTHEEGKKDEQLLTITITINSSHLLRARENEPLIRDEMEYTVLEWSITTNQRREVIESPHSWNPTELIVTANPHESHLRCDSNKHTNRYQSEWRKHIVLPVMTKRNACDYWMGDVSISNGFGEWAGLAIPTILYNWLYVRQEWSICEWSVCTETMDSHTVMNGMCGTKSIHPPLGDQLKKRWRAPISIRERGMKWVLPVIVTRLL